MRLRTFILFLLFALYAPAHALGEPTLLRFSQDETLVSTRVRLDFSALPPHRVQVSGQRVDLFLTGARASQQLSLPLEDNSIIRTLLAQSDAELVVSLLLRRPPARAYASAEGEGTLLLEIFWDSDGGVRPSIAFSVSGMPAARAGAGVLQRPSLSRYAGRWEAFFDEYRVAFRPEIPLFHFLPHRPREAFGEIPREIEGLALADRWSQVLDTLRTSAAPSEPQKRLDLAFLRAEALVRTGAFAQGIRHLEALAHKDLPLYQQHERIYLLALGAALQGDPYLARLHLSAMQEPSGPYAPHIRLLQGELALVIDRPAEALEYLQDDRIDWPSAVRAGRDLRLADALFLSGRPEEARAHYRSLLVRPELLKQNAFSLSLCAESFAAAGEHEQAAFLYEELAKVIPPGDAHGLALFAAALSHLEAGDRSRALTFLNQLRVDYSRREAGHRAHLKMLDLDVLSGDEIRRREAEGVYGTIAAAAFRRELREEAAFKQAVVLALMQEKQRSIEHLIRFNRDFARGGLRAESGALLRELVPPRIAELIERGEDLQALVLVERTREDLLAGGMDLSFLLDVAEAAARLGLFERASRVYLYLLDGPDESQKKEGFYLPLIALAADSGQYRLAVDFARRYGQRYPGGRDAAAVLVHQLRALRALGRTEEALELLRPLRRPTSAEVELLAAEIFWEAQDFAAVAETFSAPGIDIPPKGLLLRAEALRRLDRPEQALPLFRTLLGHEKVGDQAAFRTAQIELSMGHRPTGLNILRHLSEEGRDPLWRRLAAEALATERM